MFKVDWTLMTRRERKQWIPPKMSLKEIKKLQAVWEQNKSYSFRLFVKSVTFLFGSPWEKVVLKREGAGEKKIWKEG